MQVGIIGVGLIGGSMAVDLKNRGFADRVVGVEADALHASAAKELGLVDEIVSYEECIAMSDMIVVAVPVSIAIRMIPDILDKVDRQVVTDVCSTKENINDMVRYHPNRKNFVAAHPMAGTEYSGPWAALPGLFDGRAGIICNAEDSDMQAVELVKQMYDCLNMRVIYIWKKKRMKRISLTWLPVVFHRRYDWLKVMQTCGLRYSLRIKRIY